MSRWSLLLGILLVSLPTWASTDRSGSSDDPLLERFPLSYIVNYSQRKIPEYRLILGGLEKVNGVITPEREARYKGGLTRITYRIPDGHGAREPFLHFRSQLQKQNAEILFECEGRDCGSSNYWANSIFRYSKLYGVDRTQSYLAARIGQTYFAVYSVIRGNKRVFAHVEALQSEQADFTQALRQEGYARLPNNGDLPTSLFAYLNDNPDVQLWLVGFDRSQDSVQTGINRSLNQLDALKQKFVEQQIDESRIHLYGVGPLAPLMVGEGETGIYIIRE